MMTLDISKLLGSLSLNQLWNSYDEAAVGSLPTLCAPVFDGLWCVHCLRKSGAKMFVLLLLLTLFLSSWHAFPALDFDNHDEETLKGGTPPYLWPIKVMLDCWSTRPKSSIGAEQKKRPEGRNKLFGLLGSRQNFSYLLLFLSKYMINELCIAAKVFLQ